MTLMRCISVISRCATQFRNDRFEGTGLSGYQYAYILNVCRNPGISQEGLAKAIYVNKSNVARQVAKLENNGYIERRMCATNRRITEVYPTQKTYDILPLVCQVLGDWNAYITEGYTDEMREHMINMLQQVMERAMNYVDGREEKDSDSE